jgi:hypothetical protein
MIIIMVKSKYYVPVVKPPNVCVCVYVAFHIFSFTKNISHFLLKLLVRSTFDGLGITSTTSSTGTDASF